MDDPTDACAGENRADPNSWHDPDIAEAWEDPPGVDPDNTPREM